MGFWLSSSDEMVWQNLTRAKDVDDRENGVASSITVGKRRKIFENVDFRSKMIECVENRPCFFLGLELREGCALCT